MSLSHSSSIVTNGLIFAYDMSNTQKSWKGAPTTNVLADTDNLATSNWSYTLFGNWPATGATANIGIAPDGTQTATRLSASGYSRFQRYTVSANQTYTFSMWVKNINMAGGIGIQLATGLNGTLVSYGSYYTSVSLANSWARYSYTITIPASGVNQLEVGINVNANSYNSNVFCDVWRPQLELQSFATPFVIGTRSGAQSVLNIVNKTNTFVQPSNLIYSSTGTFSFNGSSSVLLGGDLSASAWPADGIKDDYTVELWFKPYVVENYRNVFDGTGAVNYGPRLEMNSAGNLVWITGNSGGSYTAYNVVTSGLQANVYHHVCITMAGNVVNTYYNGNNVVTATATYTNDSDRFYSVVFGRGFSTSGERWFSGEIAVGKIYNRALSTPEIKQNFQALRGRYGI